MSHRTLEQLEHELHRDDSHHPGPDLVAIRAAGMHRRHLSALATGVGVLAAMVVLGLVLSGTLGPGGRAVDPQPPDTRTRSPHSRSEPSPRSPGRPGCRTGRSWCRRRLAGRPTDSAASRSR